jgi:hypothetical protein
MAFMQPLPAPSPRPTPVPERTESLPEPIRRRLERQGFVPQKSDKPAV